MNVDLTITGLQEAQAKNIRRIAKLSPRGSLHQLVHHVTMYTHRQAVAVTHVDTGALRASHRMTVQGARGRVFIAPGAVNPRSRQKVSVYAEHEHALGGSHAFYRRARQSTEIYFRQFAKEFQSEVVNG